MRKQCMGNESRPSYLWTGMVATCISVVHASLKWLPSLRQLPIPCHTGDRVILDWDWETPVLLGLGGILFLALFCLKFYTTPWCFVCSPLGFKWFCDSASQQASLSHLYFLGLSTGTSGWNPIRGNKTESSRWHDTSELLRPKLIDLWVWQTKQSWEEGTGHHPF